MDNMSQRRPVTVEDLTWVLFGNPINPEDKGLIGRMQDTMKAIQRLLVVMFLTFLTATIGFAFDVIMRIGGIKP